VTWEQTIGAHGSAAPHEVWSALTTPLRWREWNDGIEWVALEGPLAPGSYATVKPHPGRQTAFHIEAVVADRLLTAFLTLGPLAALSVAFTLAEDEGGSHVALTIGVRGPLGGLMRKRAEQIAVAMGPRLERLVAG
jgi:hypothetical protein